MQIRQNLIVTARALAAAVVIVAIIGQPWTVQAAEAPCVADPERPSVRPVAPAAIAADLTEPFRYVPAEDDRAALLAEVASVVSEQAADGDAESCYLEKPARIASRVDFLSPFEFLVVTTFDQEPARRDALLDLYPSDPRGAIKQLGDAFPSPRAQATLTAFAYYDLATDRIRVNAAKVPPEQLRRVLVHEFWHAMPRARTWTERDGRTLRASGFWLQEQRAGRRDWMPFEDRRGLPYASYLLDEAMATYMETRHAGPSPFARHDLDEVRRFLERLMDVAGSDTVMRSYLESRPYELGALVEAHRSSFPDLEIAARP